MDSVKLIFIALFFNLFDFLTGFIQALKNKEIKSNKMRDGLFKKVGFIFCYVLAFSLDTWGHTVGLELPVVVLPVVIGYTVLTECVSIIENICKINSDLIPQKLKKMFHLGDK